MDWATRRRVCRDVNVLLRERLFFRIDSDTRWTYDQFFWALQSQSAKAVRYCVKSGSCNVPLRRTLEVSAERARPFH